MHNEVWSFFEPEHVLKNGLYWISLIENDLVDMIKYVELTRFMIR